MSKGLRLSEKWFRRGLWMVAVVFASFLIGLGGTIVEQLPRVERSYTLNDFMDPAVAAPLHETLDGARKTERAAHEALEQAELKLKVAESTSSAARETFVNWLATRQVTERPEQDQELIKRSAMLDELKAAEQQARARVEVQQQAVLDARQSAAGAEAQLNELEQAAAKHLTAEQRRQEFRIFLYRLALTLPLLVVAGWLFAKQRKRLYWPFVWGFCLFALFAFFVELAPYLPSYGGYVRYTVGIVVTAVIGWQAILAFNRYLEQQKAAEQLPDARRREELSYDTALARLASSVCPGCERAVDLKDAANDFCPHCGICLHDHCSQCNSRKSAFAKFCHACGTSAGVRSQAAA